MALIAPGVIGAEAVTRLPHFGDSFGLVPNGPFPTGSTQRIRADQILDRSQSRPPTKTDAAVAPLGLALVFVGDARRDALDPREQL